MKILSMILLTLVMLSGCVPTSTPETNVPPAPVQVTVDTTPTIVITNDDFQEDTTAITVTNTYLKITNPYFSSETHEETKRLVIEWNEGSVSFCKLNNTILYSDADKVVSHQYKYLSTDIIEIQKGNTLEGIARDHNTTVNKLRALNPNLGKVLSIGKSIKIK